MGFVVCASFFKASDTDVNIGMLCANVAVSCSCGWLYPYVQECSTSTFGGSEFGEK